MSYELYVQALSAMFLFWNGARILTYIPTIGKLPPGKQTCAVTAF